MNQTQLTERITRLLRQVSYGEHVRPTRDWLLVITLLGILLIGSVTWNYWVFYRVSTEDGALPGTVAPAPIPASTIETVQRIFDARAAERAHYQNDYRFVDPSR